MGLVVGYGQEEIAVLILLQEIQRPVTATVRVGKLCAHVVCIGCLPFA